MKKLLTGLLIVGALLEADTLKLDTAKVTAPRARVLCSLPLTTTYRPPPQQYTGKYILASLAIPGVGEMWMKSRVKGEALLWTDAAVWVTYGAMQVVGNSRDQSAKLFAREYSGSTMNQRTGAYYKALEEYPTSDDYNADVRRDARQLYPDDPNEQYAYIASHSYTGDNAWAWDSDSLRYAYWYQRMDARNVLHTASFFLGAAVVDRLLSVIDVAFFTRAPRSLGFEESRNQGALGSLNPRPSESCFISRLGAAPTLDQPGMTVFYRF